MTTPNTGVIQFAAGDDGNLWYVGGAGNVVGRIVDEAFNTPTLAAAVLPGSRSVQVGTPATAFATIINASATDAIGCSLSDALSNSPATFSYQTTDPATNALTGTANTPAPIAANGLQTFVFALTPTGPFVPTNLRINFACDGVGSVALLPGLNTLLLSGSNTPVPDVIALGGTLSGDGIVNIAGATGAGVFVVATSNVGAPGTITLTADTGGVNLPVTLTVCETDPLTSSCKLPPAPSVTIDIATGATPTYGIFVAASATIAFDPAFNRVTGRFTDAGGVIRGATSVAVRTQ